MSFIIASIAVISVLVLIEIVFRISYRAKYGRNYHVSIKFPWKESHVVPHPFLSFAYKRNSVIDRNQRLPYPIHTNKYFSFKEPLRINNMGHFGKDFSTEKPSGVLRIACLGHSSTSNNLGDDNGDHTYPQYIEDYLTAKLGRMNYPKQAEVYNCGIGGWVSIDIMIDFLVNIIHTRPDYVILYCGYNDLYFHLNDEFEPDYSHNRKNLGEVLHVIKRGYYFPKIKFWHSYECLKDTWFGTGNVRNEVLRKIIISKPKANQDYRHLSIERDIIKNILIVCKYYGIRMILPSFVYYDYEDTPLAKKIAEGVRLENIFLKSLSEEFDAVFVDTAAMIPQRDEMFLDCVHFTPQGMQSMGRILGDAVLRDLESQWEAGGPCDETTGGTEYNTLEQKVTL
jgi:lysophospholipase L1-like esterase